MAPNYQPKVYREQGGDAFNVAAGGAIKIDGTAALPDTNGYVYAPAGFREQIEIASSTAASLSTEGGITLLTCSSNIDYTLPAIAAGMAGLRKTLIKTNATTTVLAIINQPTSTSFWVAALDIINLGAVYEPCDVFVASTTATNWYYGGGLNSTANFAASA